MSTTHIGWAGLAASLVLVAVAVGLSGWQRLHLSRSILWACARAAVQLFVVGWALKLVLDPDASVAWAWRVGGGDGGVLRHHHPQPGAARCRASSPSARSPCSRSWWSSASR